MNTKKLLKDKQGIRLDVGGGANPHPGFVNIDYRPLPQVDIVHNLEQFPYPLKDNSVLVAVSSHVVEHLNPHYGDARVKPLIDLLIEKKLVTEAEVLKNVGFYDNMPRFMRFMDEMWRIMKPGGEFLINCPYAESHGMHQDPTHVNFINETTFEYFDPLGPRTGGYLYRIYKPKPWKIKEGSLVFHSTGNIQVVFIKRLEDESYYA